MYAKALLICVAAFAPLAGAYSMDGPMKVFEPYIGTWSCTEQSGGKPPHDSVFLFEWDGGLLRELIHAPKSAEMPQGEVVSAAFAFDAKSERYVEIEMYDNAQWYASVAGPPTGGAFHWVDKATSEIPSRWEMALPVGGTFVMDSFDHPEDSKPSYHAICKRVAN